MALTITKPTGWQDSAGFGNLRVVQRNIVLDDSYPDDGEALTAATLGLKAVLFAIPSIFKDSGNDNGILVTYDIAGSKLLVLWGNAGSASVLPEVTASTDLAAYSGRMLFGGY